MRKIFTCLSLLALFAFSVAAQGQTSIDYIDENGETQNTSTYTPVTANDTEWKDGTYVATGNISLSGRVTVTGSVTLILADDCNLNATQGINVGEGQSLTVYGQSEGTGNLTATGTSIEKMSLGYRYYNGDAGIGGNHTDVNFGTITLAATGTISATGGERAAGIGGGGIMDIEANVTGTIHICQGTVTATGGKYTAGIGVGVDCYNKTTITISGGTVTANGGDSSSSSIGNGYSLGTTGTFSTGKNGNAIIYTNKDISDDDDTSNWSGIIFEGNVGKVYGTSVSPRYDFTIPNGYTLLIPEGTTLTISENITVTNNGTIINYGAVTNNGKIDNSGTIYSTSDISGVTIIDPGSTPYIDCNGTQQAAPTFPMIANIHEWIDGWYVVTGNVTFNERITFSGDVKLILADGCNLNATQGINVGPGNSLTIYGQAEGTGNLTATGTKGGESADAGIGGNGTDVNFGTITLAATGTITATGEKRASGIGGGGIMRAETDVTGTIYICQGTVNATGGGWAAGIGVGADCYNKTSITISGGTVTANGGDGSSSSIGNGNYQEPTGTFSTGENGNAIIYADKGISDKDDTSGWSCIVFESSNSGKVYGNPAIEDFTLESGKTLEVPTGTTLTIPEGVILYNNGTINVTGGTITGEGMIVGNQPTVTDGTNNVAQGFLVTCYPSTEATTDEDKQERYIKENATIPADIFEAPDYQTLEGWYKEDGTTKVETVTEAVTVYAHWMPKPFNTTEDGITFDNLVYGIAFEHTFTAEELSEDITTNSNGLKSIAIKEPEGEEGTTNALPTGLTLEGLTLSGTTEAATPSDVTTILTLTANNGATADITLTFTIAKAEATVADWTTESPYIYTGKAITITAPKVTGINDEDVTYTDVTVAYKQGETDVEAAIEPGEYTATATYTGNSNYADTSKEVTFVIQSPDDITASASEGVLQAGDNGWMRLANGQSYPVTLTAPTNYTFTEEAMATISGDGAHTYTLKRSESSQTATVSHTLYLDATAPTATLGTPSSTTVVLTLADATSGIASCIVKEGETVLYTYPESTAETRSGETEEDVTTGEHSLSYTYTGEAGTSHTLTVSLTDMAGNTTTQDISVTFTKYTITLQQPEHGSISADKTEATEGETVTLSYREDSNYDFAGWSVTTDDGTAVSVSGNSFVMPAANVTVTAQFHYDPPYIPSYYDIYFDGNENDSVRYDCSNTSIREGGTFAFYAEPVTGYDPETLIVEYKRGRAGSWKTVEPNSRGQYRITNVHADIYVRSRVEPIEDPTALDKVGDGKSSIRCDGRRIRISTTEPQTMHIINVGGRLIRTAQLPAGDTEVNDLPQGFYIVLLSDGTRAKTLIN